jgi:hypothetical protein
VNTITKRDLSRKPSALSALQPGESLRVEDNQGGFIVTRAKGRRPTAEEMDAEIKRLSGKAPKLDTLAFLQEGEA